MPPFNKLLKMNKMLTFLLIYSFIFTNLFAVQVFAQTNMRTSANASALAKYTTDLTQLALNGRLRVNDSYKNETSRLMKSLTGGELRQTVILDETSENQELIIEQTAIRAAKELPAKRILKLEVAAIYSNAKSDRKSRAITNSIFSELAQTGDTILFVDELTNFIGRSNVGASLNNLLLQGKIRIIGGSSKVAYKENIEPVAEVDALFEKITVGDNANFSSDKSNNTTAKYDGYRGDNVSSDLREMMADDPTGKKRVEVIIQAKEAENAALRALLKSGQARLSDRIGESDTLVVNLPLSAVSQLSESGLINYISPNRPVKMFGHVENTTGATFARTANAGTTLDGSGIGIAIIDSGMFTDHNAFKNGTTSRVVYSQSFVPGESAIDDGYGHGTHVGSLAAGSANRNSGAYTGIAPNANIINLKVLNNQGTGNVAWLLNALDWVKTNHQTYNIRVINLSLGGPAIDSYTNDPVTIKVQQT